MFVLVSAIITTHNRQSLLKRAIESVLSQTYHPLECIVVDDNSDDGTAGICAKYEGLRYIYISKDDSRGGNYARNIGIKAAKGKFIAFLDDDDCWLPTKIERQMNIMSQTNAGVIYTARRFEIIGNDGKVTYKDSKPNPLYRGNLSSKIFLHIPATTSSLLIKKHLLEQVGYFDEELNFWQEYDLMIRLAQVAEFDYVDEPLLLYRTDLNDSARLTNKYHPWKHAVTYIKKKYKNQIKQLNCGDKLKFSRMIAGDALLRAVGNTSQLDALSSRVRYYMLSVLCKIIK